MDEVVRFEGNKTSIISMDKEFSAYSEKHGMTAAFLQYAHDSVVMLKRNALPLVGKMALENSYSGYIDSTFTLTWEPLYADISSSGDLGYSYGIFTLQHHHDSGILHKGTYCSIWKRDKEGQWKFVLDVGNEGLGEEEME